MSGAPGSPADKANVDDDLFGINLGPGHKRAEEEAEAAAAATAEADTPPDEPSPERKTLTQRLAAAADDRADAEARVQNDRSIRDEQSS